MINHLLAEHINSLLAPQQKQFIHSHNKEATVTGLPTYLTENGLVGWRRKYHLLLSGQTAHTCQQERNLEAAR